MTRVKCTENKGIKVVNIHYYWNLVLVTFPIALFCILLSLFANFRDNNLMPESTIGGYVFIGFLLTLCFLFVYPQRVIIEKKQGHFVVTVLKPFFFKKTISISEKDFSLTAVKPTYLFFRGVNQYFLYANNSGKSQVKLFWHFSGNLLSDGVNPTVNSSQIKSLSQYLGVPIKFEANNGE